MKYILFKPFLTRAVISGHKTQTRRIIDSCNVPAELLTSPQIIDFLINAHAAYKINDVVVIREGYRLPKDLDKVKPTKIHGCPIEYKTGGTVNCIGDFITNPGKWRPSIHMPDKFARYYVKVSNIRVEQLTKISPADCIAEGIKAHTRDLPEPYYEIYGTEKGTVNPVLSFASLWDSMGKPGDFKKNPWVFAYDFNFCDKEGNIIRAITKQREEVVV